MEVSTLTATKELRTQNIQAKIGSNGAGIEGLSKTTNKMI